MYFDKGMYKEAEELLFDSMQLSEKFEDFYYSIDIAKVLYNLYNTKGENEKKKEIALAILDFSNHNNINEANMWSVDKLLEIAIENNDLELVKEVHEKINLKLNNF